MWSPRNSAAATKEEAQVKVTVDAMDAYELLTLVNRAEEDLSHPGNHAYGSTILVAQHQALVRLRTMGVAIKEWGHA